MSETSKDAEILRLRERVELLEDTREDVEISFLEKCMEMEYQLKRVELFRKKARELQIALRRELNKARIIRESEKNQ